MADKHANFAYSTVATAPSPASSGTSLVVASGDGAKFPTPPFNATVWPANTQPTTANAEIIRVTAIATDTFTITRTQEGTAARSVGVGDQIANTITAKVLTDVEFDQYADTYITIADETIAANTQVKYEDYLELSASFAFELAAGAMLVVGDYATPLPGLDQYANTNVTVADETFVAGTEVIFSDFYELSAPFAVELASGGFLQVGTGSDIGAVLPPGFEMGYTQVTSNVNVVSTTESAGTTILSPPPLVFDGGQWIAHFYAIAVTVDSNAIGDSVIFSLFEGTTEITRIGFAQTSETTNSNSLGIKGEYRFAPTPGIHTYTITAFATSTTGTPKVVAGSGGIGYPPCFVRFTKV